MRTILVAIVAAIAAVTEYQGQTCWKDSDCGYGEVCLKDSPYAPTGRCVRGARP